jgi:diaminopropionate ammonia-lyase
MKLTPNPFRGGDGPAFDIGAEVPAPSVDAEAPLALLRRCPAYAPTPLVDHAELANQLGVAACWIKDERGRMGLGSFKALGAAYVIAHDAMAADPDAPQTALAGRTYVTASAGNHGMSVAAGARVFGARAVVYIADTVPEAFAERLRAKGAEVVREGAIYEDSMAAAARAAQDKGWQLLSDSSWPGYMDAPHRLMEGYLALMAEAFGQVPESPTHIFLQAGVGGLAGACAAIARDHWGDAPQIIVVEPEAAPALEASIRAGRFVATQGPASAMGRLDCKEASLIALKGLARDADGFALISEEEAQEATDAMAATGFETTPSGVAGLAAALADHQGLCGLDAASRVLVILSEGPEA